MLGGDNAAVPNPSAQQSKLQKIYVEVPITCHQTVNVAFAIDKVELSVRKFMCHSKINRARYDSVRIP